MSAISDIRHRHLFFRYWRQICRTENCHSDIGSVPISTSESIPISDIYKNFIYTTWIWTRDPWKRRLELHHSATLLFLNLGDVGYRIKLNSISDIMLDSALSVRYRRFRYQAQSDIADHGYRTECPPMNYWLVHRHIYTVWSGDGQSSGQATPLASGLPGRWNREERKKRKDSSKRISRMTTW
jgi:hypothetical protein